MDMSETWSEFERGGRKGNNVGDRMKGWWYVLEWGCREDGGCERRRMRMRWS